MIPSPYLQYFYHRQRKVREAARAELTRGEQVRMLEKEVFEAYADPNQDTKPAALAKRGGGGYSEIALGVMDSIANNLGRMLIVNTANRGAVDSLPGEAVLELPCMVNASGIFPLKQPEIPRAVWGLIAAVKNYEQLVVEAAVTGSRETAVQALLAHPLVGEWELARTLFDEMLEANREYLPQFEG
jgi:6-phospho-beta-glucosidase